MPVEYQEKTFDCFIQDPKTGDKYSASVRVKKRRPLDISRKEGKMKLCDIFVDSVSAVEGQKHHHFAMHTLNGEGIYIFRVGKEDESERPYSIWDLGPVFGKLVTRALQKMA
jgi:hypothetical protein